MDWISRQKATRHQLQQLLSKLIYVAYCCKPARLFVARMLHTLREAPPRGEIQLDNEFRMDLSWFEKFMPKFIAIQLIQPICSNIVVEADSCLSGCGAIFAQEYYHAIFPELITKVNMHISRLKMLNLVVGTKMWSHNWDRKNVIIYCDNSAAVLTLQSGRSRDPFLLACARELWLHAALGGFQLMPRHKSGKEMIVADALSREHLSAAFRKKLESILQL